MHRAKDVMRAAVAATALVAAAATVSGQVTVPDRPAKPLSSGQPGEQRSPDLAYDAASGTVTVKLPVEDVNGFFIPKLRRNNFAVFEDGVRQHNATVEIEHAPVTLAVLMEMGGRSQQLNKTLASQGPYVARPVLDVLGRDDKLAVFTYDDRLHTVVDFDAAHDTWDAALESTTVPQFSETNFYDAAITVLDRLATMPGRKALLVVSTGIDTFSHATFGDVVGKAEAANTPVYVIGLGDIARQSVTDASRGPLARVDWSECERQLETLARSSGGRAYLRASTVDVPSIYDDIMENLRVRYVITYVPSRPVTTATRRTVQVKLVDANTGAPLRLTDASGRRVTARNIAEASYMPATVGRTSG